MAPLNPVSVVKHKEFDPGHGAESLAKCPIAYQEAYRRARAPENNPKPEAIKELPPVVKAPEVTERWNQIDSKDLIRLLPEASAEQRAYGASLLAERGAKEATGELAKILESDVNALLGSFLAKAIWDLNNTNFDSGVFLANLLISKPGSWAVDFLRGVFPNNPDFSRAEDWKGVELLWPAISSSSRDVNALGYQIWSQLENSFYRNVIFLNNPRKDEEKIVSEALKLTVLHGGDIEGVFRGSSLPDLLKQSVSAERRPRAMAGIYKLLAEELYQFHLMLNHSETNGGLQLGFLKERELLSGAVKFLEESAIEYELPVASRTVAGIGYYDTALDVPGSSIGFASSILRSIHLNTRWLSQSPDPTVIESVLVHELIHAMANKLIGVSKDGSAQIIKQGFVIKAGDNFILSTLEECVTSFLDLEYSRKKGCKVNQGDIEMPLELPSDSEYCKILDLFTKGQSGPDKENTYYTLQVPFVGRTYPDGKNGLHAYSHILASMLSLVSELYPGLDASEGRKQFIKDIWKAQYTGDVKEFTKRVIDNLGKDAMYLIAHTDLGAPLPMQIFALSRKMTDPKQKALLVKELRKVLQAEVIKRRKQESEKIE